MNLLNLKNINVSYGQVHAVRGVDLNIDEGEVIALVGSNGAGKSTILKSIMGIHPPKNGQIIFNDMDITGLDPADIVTKGIALSPEGRRIFPKMSVHENLLSGAHLHHDKNENQKLLQEIYTQFPRLFERKSQLAGSLSGGEQQMLAIGRALMARPKLLLLDEPTLGLAPIIVKEIASTILNIQKKGVSILLVEQNANMALRVCSRALVIENGEIKMRGNGADLLKNDHIRSFYLGL